MTDVLQEYQSKIDAIPGLRVTGIKRGWSVHVETEEDNPKLALKQIRNMQSQLRLLKKQLNLRMKLTRAEYRQRIADATYTPGVGGALFGSKYRGAMRRDATVRKRRLRSERDDLLYPYQQIKDGIDQLLLQLDSMKLELQT